MPRPLHSNMATRPHAAAAWRAPCVRPRRRRGGGAGAVSSGSSPGAPRDTAVPPAAPPPAAPSDWWTGELPYARPLEAAKRAHGQTEVGGAGRGGEGAGGAPPPARAAAAAAPRRKLSEVDEQRLDAFWAAQGVRLAAQRRKLVALGERQLLFRDAPRLAAAMELVRGVLWRYGGLMGLDLPAMVAKYPKILLVDPEYSIGRKLRVLHRVLPGVRSLRRVVERCPGVFSLDVDYSVAVKLRELLELMPGADVVRMVERFPQLLTVDVRGSVSPKLARLRKLLLEYGVDPVLVDDIVAASPRLLVTRTETVTARVRRVEELAPGAVAAYAGKPSTVARVLSASAEVVERLAFLDEAYPGVRLEAGDTDGTRRDVVRVGPMRVITLPRRRFDERFPGFDEWLARREAGEGG